MMQMREKCKSLTPPKSVKTSKFWHRCFLGNDRRQKLENRKKMQFCKKKFLVKSLISQGKSLYVPKLVFDHFELFLAFQYTSFVVSIVKSCEEPIFDHQKIRKWFFDPQINDFDVKKAQIKPKWPIWARFERFSSLLYASLVVFIVKSCEEPIFGHQKIWKWIFDPQINDFHVKMAQNGLFERILRNLSPILHQFYWKWEVDPKFDQYMPKNCIKIYFFIFFQFF